MVKDKNVPYPQKPPAPTIIAEKFAKVLALSRFVKMCCFRCFVGILAAGGDPNAKFVHDMKVNMSLYESEHLGTLLPSLECQGRKVAEYLQSADSAQRGLAVKVPNCSPWSAEQLLSLDQQSTMPRIGDEGRNVARTTVPRLQKLASRVV